MKKSTIWIIVLVPLFFIIGSLAGQMFYSLFSHGWFMRGVGDFIDNGSECLHIIKPYVILFLAISFVYNLIKYFVYKFRGDNEKTVLFKKYFTQALVLGIVLFLEFSILAQVNYTFAKPVIYLYPTRTEQVNVKLDFKGKIIADYPEYNNINGWTVTANPDGTIINQDGKEYSYLFWEGKPDPNPDFDMSVGFVVKGEDTREFLQNTLPKFGFTPKEYNEFVVYWYPVMQNNKYNLIHFATDEYVDTVALNVTPEPDSILRVFMAYQPLQEYKEVKPQEIKNVTRQGFTVVEWGGSEIQ